MTNTSRLKILGIGLVLVGLAAYLLPAIWLHRLSSEWRITTWVTRVERATDAWEGSPMKVGRVMGGVARWLSLYPPWLCLCVLL